MSDVRQMTDHTLLSMLLGGEVASQYQGLTLVDIFGLSPQRNCVSENEAAYVAAPVLQAAKELLTRAMSQDIKLQRNCLTSPAVTRDFLRLSIGHLEHEVFYVMFLDAQNGLIESCEMFRGTLTQTSVYPREVIKAALQHNAASVIFAHNHPSGVAEPSNADVQLTLRLKAALALVDIKVLDHLIVAGDKPTSMAELGLI